MLVSDFNYDLPEERIAKFPPKERGTTRLLVLDRKSGEVKDSFYRNLDELLNPGDLLILNDTRVMQSRLFCELPDGRERELVVLEKHGDEPQRVMYRGKLHDGDVLFIKFEGIRSAAARGRAPAARGDGPAGRGPRANNNPSISKGALDLIAELSGGDARSALGDLELALSLSSAVDEKVVEEAAGRKLPGYDKKGDKHYDTISAFIKSMRGSDVDAALYYLARMVESGEDPKFIARRMVVFASEDIGLAGNGALSLATACFQAVERVGMPESGLMLAHTCVALTMSKKSRATTDAWYKALDLARKTRGEPVPVWLRNAPTKLMKDLGYGKGQKWEAGFHLDKNYLPNSIKDEKIWQS